MAPVPTISSGGACILPTVTKQSEAIVPAVIDMYTRYIMAAFDQSVAGQKEGLPRVAGADVPVWLLCNRGIEGDSASKESSLIDTVLGGGAVGGENRAPAESMPCLPGHGHSSITATSEPACRKMGRSSGRRFVRVVSSLNRATSTRRC